MYLSDRDLRWAIECGKLKVEPKPDRIEPTSIDLHLDVVEQAKVWDIEHLERNQKADGQEPRELRIGKFEYKNFAPKYLIPPPEDKTKPVFRRGRQIIIKPGGFLLWQTKEHVGTPEGARQVCR